MKKISALLLALVLTLGFVGCATTGSTGSTSPALTEAQLAKAATLTKTTVRSALILVIDKNGTNAIPYVTLARDTISILLSGTNYSPGALQASLTKLPIKQLKQAEVQLAVSTLVG